MYTLEGGGSCVDLAFSPCTGCDLLRDCQMGVGCPEQEPSRLEAGLRPAEAEERGFIGSLIGMQTRP